MRGLYAVTACWILCIVSCYGEDTTSRKLSARCENGANPMLDVVWVLDSSNSVKSSSWKQLKTFVKEVSEEFTMGDEFTRFGYVMYATKVQYKWLTSSRATWSRYLNRLQRLTGGTATPAALERANTFFIPRNYRTGSRRVVIVATDGQPNIRRTCDTVRDYVECSRQKAIKLKEDDDAIFVYLRIGRGASETLFEGIEDYRIDADFNDLSSVKELLIKIANCPDDDIPVAPTVAPTFGPPTTPQPTKKPTKGPTANPTPPTKEPTRSPIVPPPTVEGQCQSRVVLAVDESMSMETKVRDNQKRTIDRFINNLEIEEWRTRVGLLTFSKTTKEVIPVAMVNAASFTKSTVQTAVSNFYNQPATTRGTDFREIFEKLGNSLNGQLNPFLIIVSDMQPWVKGRKTYWSTKRNCEKAREWKKNNPNVKVYCVQTSDLPSPTKFTKCACTETWRPERSKIAALEIAYQLKMLVCPAKSSERLINPCDEVNRIPRRRSKREAACKAVKRTSTGKTKPEGYEEDKRLRKQCNFVWSLNKCFVRHQFKYLYLEDTDKVIP
mmetsp:Transcript_2635/g.5132  ORF Transcript_2635/g.5132 Transcript_2635/m.5132 type:complete len:553 (+) Transcript_2635:184-1842(+)